MKTCFNLFVGTAPGWQRQVQEQPGRLVSAAAPHLRAWRGSGHHLCRIHPHGDEKNSRRKTLFLSFFKQVSPRPQVASIGLHEFEKCVYHRTFQKSSLFTKVAARKFIHNSIVKILDFYLRFCSRVWSLMRIFGSN